MPTGVGLAPAARPAGASPRSVTRAGMPPGQVLDASGAIVAPGFVALHAPYDAQLQWDGGMLRRASRITAANDGKVKEAIGDRQLLARPAGP